MSNVLIVVGSPRKDGNSQMMADFFEHGALKSGNEVRQINVGRAKISGCIACESCFANNGKCAINDDMQPLYAQMEWADVIVYAFPLYFYSYPAQIKAFMDRQFCAAAGRKGIMGKKVALLMPYEDAHAERADGLVKSFEICMDYCKQEILGMVLCNGVYEKGAIKGHEALKRCQDLGESIK